MTSFWNKQEKACKNFASMFCEIGVDLSCKILGKLMLTSGG